MGIKSNIGQSLTNDNVGIGVVPVDGTNKLQVEGNATVNGNVGIGTTTPAGKLEINKPQTSGVDFTNPSLKLTSSTINNEGRTSITFPTSSVDLYGFSVSSWRAGTSSADGKFEIASHFNSATGFSRFIIDKLTGNVGVGTTAPTEKLEVSGNISVNPTSGAGVIFIRRGDSNKHFIRGGSLTPNNLEIGVIGSTSDIDFIVQGTTNALRINQDGNVGIGTTAPTEKLHVNGKIKATSINFTGLPTSATGLSAGDVWNDAGTLKIV